MIGGVMKKSAEIGLKVYKPEQRPSLKTVILFNIISKILPMTLEN